MPSDIDFRQFLMDLSDEMSPDNTARFIFLVGSDVPKRQQGNPVIEIFTTLIERGRISETDCSYLQDIFTKAKLLELAYKVARFETRHSPPTVIENIQPIEITRLSTPPTADGPRKQGLTSQEFLNDINDSDSIRIPDNDPNNSPVIIEPEPFVVPLCLENIDLKVFEKDSWSEEFLLKININIRPYEYQRELVQSAIQAKNTIICLRTGGGKTFVAALLIKYYLIKKLTLVNDDETKFLAFFIVPRRAMLQQQVAKLKQFGNLQVIACDEFNDPTQYINNYKVIVCTPQKLLNCLKAKTILLSNIDLLCVDECQDTVVRIQYIGIMQYMMCQNVGHIPPVHSSPIIIGLTADIGLHPSIIQNLINLCAIFNCLTITTVIKKENEEEFERYVSHISEDEIICIDKKKDFDLLRSSIEKELKDLILQLFLNKDSNPLRIFPDKDFDKNGYEQNLELLKQSEQKYQHFPSVLLINYIIAIYRHLKALADLTPELVLSDLKDCFNQMYQKREHPMDIDTLIYDTCQTVFTKKLFEIEQSEQVLSNPKLDKLVELLKKHTDKANYRALILVERTFYAKKICDFLQNHSELKDIIKPCWIVGQSGPDNRKSTKKEDSILKDFRTGVYNVMISTDVLRAGLDIPQCSLVLRYNFVPDSIGTVQARVRARATDCTYYLITTKDSPNYLKELENRRCEQNLKQVVEAWKQFPIDEFKQRVMDKQTSLTKEWRDSLMKAISQTNTSKKTELIGDVLCGSCDYFLGKLGRLCRNAEAYFINDDDFYNRIEEELFPEPEVYKKSSVTGKALCGNKKCRAPLGCIQISNSDPKKRPIYPLKCVSIKIKQIDKENGQEKIHNVKKWSKVPLQIPLFQIPSAEDNDEIFYDTCDTPFDNL